MADSPHIPEESSWLAAPLRVMTRLVIRWPRQTVALCVLLAVASAGWTALSLELRTSRLDLLNPKSDFNRRWMSYLDEFTAEDDTVILVEGTDPELVKGALDSLAEDLSRRPELFRLVFHKADLSVARQSALFYLPPDKLQELTSRLSELRPILEGDWSGLTVEAQLMYTVFGASSAPEATQRATALAALAQQIQNLTSALAGSQQYQSPWAQWDGLNEIQARFAPYYSVLNEGRMGVILLRLVDDGKAFDRGTNAIQHLRGMLADFQNKRTQLKVGLTGLPVMENDEMQANSSASLKSSIVSLVGVAGLFIAGFGGIRHPLLAVLTLLVGIAWSLGYIMLVVGHLNILSMAFGVILIGLGIDFGIHYVARYLALRRTIPDSGEALVRTAVGIGPGIITGGVTTAVAFYAACLTDFTGVAELGVIAGGGILLCLAATMILLPALIQWMDCRISARPVPQPLAVAPTAWLSRHAPRLTVAGSLAIVLLCAAGLPRVWYDHNLLHLQPENLESVRLEQKLLTETDQSVWFAISIANTPEELLLRKARFDKLATVERTEEIVSFLPQETEAKRPLVAEIHQELAKLPAEVPLLAVAPPPTLQRLLPELYQQLQAGGQPEAAEGIKRLAQTISDLPPQEVLNRLSTYQQYLAGDLLARLRAIHDMSEPTPSTLDDLPESLRRRFVGRSGKHLLKVYSNSDIWNMEELEKFVVDVRSIDPEATGQPLQTFEASRQMQQSYVHAALYALIGVSMVLVLDFQSLGFAMLALAPSLLGFVQMLGLLGWLGIPLNPANMIVLPLILGIGLDDGVHVVHEFRGERGPFHLTRWTATAVILTSLTTMVGFGSLMIADHRGLESLGRVMTLGVACCLFTSLIPLPALLTWLTRNRPPAIESAEYAEPSVSLPHQKLPQRTEHTISSTQS